MCRFRNGNRGCSNPLVNEWNCIGGSCEYFLSDGVTQIQKGIPV
jgi:hypothetical protein